MFTDQLKRPNSFTAGDKVVDSMLKQYEKVKNGKTNQHKIDALINFIAIELRKAAFNDHLLQTTSIWILLNIYTIDSKNSRSMMLKAGVPGVLVDIMKSKLITGVSYEYASKLCFYLCNSTEINCSLDITHNQCFSVFPKINLEPILHSRKSQIDLIETDKTSSTNLFIDKIIEKHILTEGSSYTNEKIDQLPHSFVPYRVNDRNQQRLNRLFKRQPGDCDCPGKAEVDVERPIKSKFMQSIENFDLLSDVCFDSRPIAAIASPPRPDPPTLAREGSASRNRTWVSEIESNIATMVPTTNRRILARGSASRPSDATTWAYGDDWDKGWTGNRQSSPPLQLSAETNGIASTEPSTDSVVLWTPPVVPLCPVVAPMQAEPPHLYRIPLTAEARTAHVLQRLPPSSSQDLAVAVAKIDPLTLNLERHLLSHYSEVSAASDQRSEDKHPAHRLTNPTSLPKSLKIRAESLVEMEFTKKVFNKKATLADAQSLVLRMEDMFILMDSDRTGFVTWEAFARVLLALAPPKLLRSDILNFFDRQKMGADDQCLVNYKEFCISGKALLVLRRNGRNILPLTGWLDRQKLYTGESSTYSWQSHNTWYNQRLSDAVVWLIRRATNAMSHTIVLERAVTFLQHAVRRGRAVTALMETGYCGLTAETGRVVAKRALLLRCVHARRWRNTVAEAHQYLKYTALEHIQRCTMTPQEADQLAHGKTKPMDYNRAFKIYHQQRIAMAALTQRVQRAVVHSDRSAEAFRSLSGLAQSALAQSHRHEVVHQQLRVMSERCIRYLTFQETALVYLFRRGAEGLALANGLDTALAWLRERAARAVIFTSLQQKTLFHLCGRGQFLLRFTNDRERSVAHLLRRARNGRVLIQRQKECVAWLQRLPRAIFHNEQFVSEAHLWLKDKGARAKGHWLRQIQAHRRLKFQAGRSNVMIKRIHSAFVDLQQLAQYAKYTVFSQHFCISASNLNRFKMERSKVDTVDALESKARATLGQQERWRVEFDDVFDWLMKKAPLPGKGGSLRAIGRPGFTQLLQGGRLFGLPPEAVANAFMEIDVDLTGCVRQEQLWDWFLRQAQLQHRNAMKSRLLTLMRRQNKGFVFEVGMVLPSAERAFISLLVRYLRDDEGHAEERERQMERFGVGYRPIRVRVALEEEAEVSGSEEEEEEQATAEQLFCFDTEEAQQRRAVV